MFFCFFVLYQFGSEGMWMCNLWFHLQSNILYESFTFCALKALETLLSVFQYLVETDNGINHFRLYSVILVQKKQVHWLDFKATETWFYAIICFLTDLDQLKQASPPHQRTSGTSQWWSAAEDPDRKQKKDFLQRWQICLRTISILQ